MAILQLKKAQRTKAKLKLGISAPSGGGKTLGALLIAYGLMKEKYPDLLDAELWEKVAIVDTENGSGELYVGKEISNIKIGVYNSVTLSAPFEADKYTTAIALCKEAGIEVCIIDSTTHLWSGEGGLLEQQNTAAKRSGNSYTAWRDITPQHNKFVEAMLQTDMHIIATMRSKTDYVQEKDSAGKTTVRKIGLNPIQRDGMEYEFTLFFDVDVDHMAFASKDRTSLYDQKSVKITPAVGRELMKWLEGGTANETEVVAVKSSTPIEDDKAETHLLHDKIKHLYDSAGKDTQKSLVDLFKEFEPLKGNPNKIKDVVRLEELLGRVKELTQKQNN